MKKILSALLLAFFALQLNAQSFSFSGSQAIADNGYTCVNINVSGLPAVMDTNWGLCNVCVNIAHTYDGDLDLWLVSPGGDSVRLTNNRGGGGDNFTNTCFDMSAANHIADGNPPYTGSFVPDNSLNGFNDGANPNGTWRFCTHDEAPGDVGTITSVNLTFCTNPPSDPAISGGPCSMQNGAGCDCPDGTQDCDLLPDMTASADIIAAQNNEVFGRIYLSNATPNIGWGPMEIHGSNSCWCDTVQVPCSTSLCPDNNPPTQKLIQTIYHKTNGTITSYDTLTPGTMSYHPTHGHIHVNDWAEFTLRTSTADPNPLNWPVVGAGSKISFCLINLGDCTNDYGYCRDNNNNVLTMADIPNAGLGQVSGCGTDQGIYTGMLDIYDMNLPGMYIDLNNVCNGDYYIVSITDPDNDFLETDETNNWCAVPITLTQQISPASASFNWVQVGNTYNFNYSGTGSITSFIWDFGDGTTNTTSNPATHTYASNGNYTVTLIVNGNCGSDTIVQNLSFVGVDKGYDYSMFSLTAAPNPTNGNTNLSFILPEPGNVTVELLNLQGQRIGVISQGFMNVGEQRVNFDAKAFGLAAGTYLVRVVTPEAQPSMLLEVLH